MKRPSTNAIFFVPIIGFLVAFAPSTLSVFVMLALIVLGTCVLNRVRCVAGEWFVTAVKTAVHRQYFKPPANLFAIGVVLSVVFVAIGYAWGAHVSVPMVSGKLFMSMFLIAAQLLCLGSFVGFLSLVQSAPDFRGSRG
jgi:hypothetical protein